MSDNEYAKELNKMDITVLRQVAKVLDADKRTKKQLVTQIIPKLVELDIMSTHDFICYLYIVIFDRDADDRGYNSWVVALDEDKKSRLWVIGEFLNLDEYEAVNAKIGDVGIEVLK